MLRCLPRRIIRVRLAAVLALAAALVTLAGCSALRLGYNNGAQLAWWWLDGYLDLPREPAAAARGAIDRWFEWHRASQLGGYAALLAQMQQQVLEPTDAAAACRLWAQWREQLEPALERALRAGAELVPALGEAQLRHLEQRYAKNIDDLREDHLQPDPAARQRAAFKRALDRAEQVYGTLGAAQRKVLADAVAASPFDPEAWIRERQARQRDTVAMLRRLVADQADRDTRLAALRALAERSERSPDPAYRERQRRLTDYNCGLVARLHNATTPAQRRQARENLAGWEQDLRALMAAPAAAAPAGAP